MSTTTQASRREDSPTTRTRNGILAVGAIIAIGVSILFVLLLSGTHRIATPATTSGHAASPPATHAALTAPLPAGYLRDHPLLRVGAAGCNATYLRLEKVCPRP
jgi:hypothetical protein